jgi:RHS repeat-associated protein
LRRVTWEYDGKGRRIRQTTHDLSSRDTVTEDLKFVSDGWRNIAELNGTNNALVRSYVWGLDLSGTMDGAGGVGGLLMINSTANGVHFYAYDGNGNVAALVKASDGTLSANYEYGPFGEVIRATGIMAKANPFRFSTKYQDDESDLVYYGNRYLKVSTGGWLSRDPVEEDEGGPNLYGFVGNDPVDFWDYLGWEWKVIRAGGDRAVATCDCDDTVAQLAEKVKLNAREYQKWLKATGNSSLPASADTPLAQGSTFTIPNIGYVDASSYNWGGLGYRLMHYSHHLRSTWKSEGLKVVYTGPWSTTKPLILGHLASDDIYKFAYIGHGWSGQLTGISDSSGSGDMQGIIASDKYTKFGIARMELIACQSHNSDDLWKKNVSALGILRTAKDEVTLFNFDFVDEPGQ